MLGDRTTQKTWNLKLIAGEKWKNIEKIESEEVEVIKKRLKKIKDYYRKWKKKRSEFFGEESIR